MGQLLLHVILLLPTLLAPFSTHLLASITAGQQIRRSLVQFCLILSQKPSNLLDGFTSSLHLVVFVQPVDGAFRADGIVAAEAKISQFLFCVVGAGVLQLVSFFGVRCVRWLRDRCGRIVFWIAWRNRGGRSVVILFPVFSRVFYRLIRFGTNLTVVFGILPASVRIIRCKTPIGFGFSPSLETVVNPLQFLHAGGVEFCFLAAASAVIELNDAESTFEFLG